jgi:hypothetical protein
MRFFYFILGTVLLLSTSCARRTATPAIQLLGRDGQGALTLYADGEGLVKKLAETDAKKRVLNRLLYDGITHPEITAVRLPMVDQSKLSSSQLKSLNEMMSGDELDRFFTDATWIDPKTVWASGVATKLQRYKLTLNYDLFRRTLESKGIVRKFGI